MLHWPLKSENYRMYDLIWITAYKVLCFKSQITILSDQKKMFIKPRQKMCKTTHFNAL